METPDERLADRAVRGDARAFRMLVDRHARRVFEVCHRITGNAALAEDAVQEAFLSAYRSLARFQGRSRFGTWLHRIAVNAALQCVRREQGWERRHAALADGAACDPEAVLDGPGAAPTPEREVASRLAGEALVSALGELSPLERVAFVLRHCEQLPLREIASQLAVSEGAAKQAVLRGVRKLRRSLEEHRELRDHG